jgi:nicotinamidase-related amidase
MNAHPDLCDADRSLLLLVDIQPTLSAAMPEEAAANMLEHAGGLLEAAAELSVPAFLTEQIPERLGPVDESLSGRRTEGNRVFPKTGISALCAEGFEQAPEASGRRQVILAGQEAHAGILQTPLDLRHRGYQTYVVEDAVCSMQLDNRFYALERMSRLGVTLTSFESMLFEWLRDAGHPQLSKLSALLR